MQLTQDHRRDLWRYSFCNGIASLDLSDDSDLTLDFLSRNFQATTFTNSHFLVVFTAAISRTVREKNSAPFFSGTGIAKSVKIPLLAVADPTLALNEKLMLGWYAGNSISGSLTKRIADVIDMIAIKTDRLPILLGGSGGGFAALNVLNAMTSKATAIVANPQTSIPAYSPIIAARYVNVAFPKLSLSKAARKSRTVLRKAVESELPDINFLVPNINLLTADKKVIYLQNDSDLSHVQRQASPWLEKTKFVELGCNFYLSTSGNVAFFVGDCGKGHASPPTPMFKRLLVELLKEQAFSVSSYKALSLSKYQSASKFSWSPGIDVDNQVDITLNSVDGSTMSTCDIRSYWEKPDLTYAFYVKSKGKLIQSRWYEANPTATFDTDIFKNKRTVSVFIRDALGIVRTKTVKYQAPKLAETTNI